MSRDLYAPIVALAERKLKLASAGEIDALNALDEHFDELAGGLAKPLPAPARATLQRAALIHERTHIELLRLRETLLDELHSSVRASRAARGYSPQSRRLPRLDRSA